MKRIKERPLLVRCWPLLNRHSLGKLIAGTVYIYIRRVRSPSKKKNEELFFYQLRERICRSTGLEFF